MNSEQEFRWLNFETFSSWCSKVNSVYEIYVQDNANMKRSYDQLLKIEYLNKPWNNLDRFENVQFLSTTSDTIQS